MHLHASLVLLSSLATAITAQSTCISTAPGGLSGLSTRVPFNLRDNGVFSASIEEGTVLYAPPSQGTSAGVLKIFNDSGVGRSICVPFNTGGQRNCFFVSPRSSCNTNTIIITEWGVLVSFLFRHITTVLLLKSKQLGTD